jgi:hypothetical protein
VTATAQAKFVKAIAAKPRTKPAAKPTPEPTPTATKRYRIEVLSNKGNFMLYGRRADLALAKATIERRSPIVEREMRVIDEQTAKTVASAKPPKAAAAKPKVAKPAA